jgi:hypothetical protein
MHRKIPCKHDTFGVVLDVWHFSTHILQFLQGLFNSDNVSSIPTILHESLEFIHNLIRKIIAASASWKHWESTEDGRGNTSTAEAIDSTKFAIRATCVNVAQTTTDGKDNFFILKDKGLRSNADRHEVENGMDK